MTPQRIVHLITGLGQGGAEQVLVRIATSLDRTRFSNLVVSLMPEGPLAAPLREAGVDVVSLGMQADRPSPLGLWRLFRVLHRARPDVLQSWLYHGDLLGLLAGSLAGVPAIVWNVRTADVDMSHYRRTSRWTLAGCARLSACPRAVVVNSEAGLAHHRAIGYHPREWVVIPNGVDLERFRPDPEARRTVRADLGIAESTPVVCLIGRRDPMKDHGTFLRAAAILAALHPDVVFLLAGAGVADDDPAFASLRSALAPQARVLALGRRSDVARLMAASDVSTSSSVTEGFPNVVIESMACAVPCVVSRAGDAASIVGDTGRVVEPRDPEALAAAIADVLSLPRASRDALGRRARDRVAERYTLRRMLDAYDRLYERLRAERAPPERRL